MQKTENIESLIANGDYDEARKRLDSLLASAPENAQAWYVAGKLAWRLGNRSEAMTCYSRAVAIDPDSPAAYALQQAREIADFVNPDLLNP